jgi:hypothetical protein
VFVGTYANAAIGGLDGTIFDTSVISGDATIPYFAGKIYSHSVWDAVSYQGATGEIALGWNKSADAGDFLVMPFPGNRLGTAVINYLTSNGNTYQLEFTTGRVGEFDGREVTVSWAIANLTNNDASVNVQYVVDTDNPNFPGGQEIVTDIATPVFSGLYNDRYSSTFAAPVVQGIVGPNAKTFIRLTINDANVVGLNVDKFKLEIGSFDTGYSVLDRSPSWSQAVAVLEEIQTEIDAKADQVDLDAHTSNTSNPHSVTASQVGAATTTNNGSTPTATTMMTLTQAEYDAIGTPDANTLYIIVG